MICSNLTEAYFAIKVFIHFLYHIFEAKVCLWYTKLLHHMLQFFKVNKLIFARVISIQVK